MDQHCFQNGCNEDGKRDFYFLFTVKYMYFSMGARKLGQDLK